MGWLRSLEAFRNCCGVETVDRFLCTMQVHHQVTAGRMEGKVAICTNLLKAHFNRVVLEQEGNQLSEIHTTQNTVPNRGVLWSAQVGQAIIVTGYELDAR